MAAISFELGAPIGFAPGTVTGTCELYEGASALGDPEMPLVVFPQTSNNLFQEDQSVIVRVTWNSVLPGAAFLLGGTWNFEVVAEQVGGGAVTVALPGVIPAIGTLTRNLSFGGGILPVGLHRIILSMYWLDAGGNPRAIAGFVDMGIIQVYNEP